MDGSASLNRHSSNALADLATEALIAVDRGCITYSNPAARRLFAGTAAAQPLEGRRLATLCDPCPAKPAPQPIHVRGCLLDGDMRQLEAWLQPGETEQQVLLRLRERTVPPEVAATASDIHQQERLERLLSGLDVSDDAIFLIDRATMRYLDVNEGACRLLGYPREELMRRTANQTSRTLGTVDELGAVYDEVIAHAPATQVSEILVDRADGTTIVCEVRRKPLLQSGRWIIAATLRDITAYKRTQARMNRFATALALSGDAVFLIDRASMEYVDVNEAACTLLGYAREELLRRNPYDAPLHRYTKEQLAAEYDRVIAQAPATLTREMEFVRRDGSTVVCEVRRQAIRSDTGWMIVANCRDMTERRAAQLRVQLLASAVNNSADRIYFVDRERLEFIEANDSALRHHGVATLDELKRRKPWEAIRRAMTRAEMQAIHDRVIAQAPRHHRSMDVWRSEDGAIAGAAEVTRTALQVDGRWVIVATWHDMTEHLRQQARIERFATALDLSADAVFLVDRESMKFIDVNQTACAMLGSTRDELLARSPNLDSPDLGSMEELAKVYDWAIAKSPRARIAEISLRRSDGECIPVEVRAQAIRSGDRWVIAATARDISERKKAHARMELFASSLNMSADGIFFIDRASMTYVDVNDAACDLVGLPRDVLLARRPGEFAFKSVTEMAAIYDDLIARAPATSTAEGIYRRADGSPLHAEVRRQAIHSDGRWIISVSVRDISERKAAQARNELLATAMNSSADHVVIIDPQTARVVDANEAALKFHGLQRDEALAIDVWAPLPHYSREQMTAEYRRAIEKWPEPDRAIYLSRGVKSGRTGIFDVRRQALQVDGRWVVLATATEVTERQEHLARIERLAAAMDLGEDGVLLVDAQSREILYANEATARLIGRRREELVGMRDDATAQLGPAFEDVIRESPATLAAEINVRAPGGREVPCEIRRQAIRSQDRWIIVSTLRDISERHQAEEEIRRKVAELTRSNQELEQFAYVTSHDLSEPLRMVASYTQLLERRYSSHFDADAHEFMGYIVGGAQRMKQLIDDLLTYSRAGRPNVQMKEFPLDRALDDALANLAHAIQVSGARIEREPLPAIVGDKSGMVQVFQNLIANAIKFHAENVPPLVRIGVQDAGAEWLIAVSDNGIGIAPEYFQRIFVIFQRLHPRQKYEGTGIGLAICKKVMDRHGGQIEVESRPGAGATFRMRLPKSAPRGNKEHPE
jgi:PAS domain S-box-containing protein